jgi:hypothetical protein
MSDWIDEEVKDRLSNCHIDCPECECIDDDQYQCTTCWAEGQISVISLFNDKDEKIEILRESLGNIVKLLEHANIGNGVKVTGFDLSDAKKALRKSKC